MGKKENQLKLCCNSCFYYCSHYIKVGKGYRVTPFGHCRHDRVKLRNFDTPHCKYYREIDNSPFY